VSAFGRSIVNDFDIGKEWPKAVAAASKVGVHLPPYAGTGALFSLDPRTLRVARSVRLSLSDLPRRSRARWIRGALRYLRP
jgi:hypothetical protein